MPTSFNAAQTSSTFSLTSEAVQSWSREALARDMRIAKDMYSVYTTPGFYFQNMKSVVSIHRPNDKALNLFRKMVSVNRNFLHEKEVAEEHTAIYWSDSHHDKYLLFHEIELIGVLVEVDDEEQKVAHAAHYTATYYQVMMTLIGGERMLIAEFEYHADATQFVKSLASRYGLYIHSNQKLNNLH